MPENCPAPEELLACALAASDNWSPRLASHRESCTSCHREVTELQRSVIDLRLTAEPGKVSSGECLDEMAVAELMDGVASEERRATLLAHVAECAQCRRVVASVARMTAEPDIRREVTSVESATGPRRRVLRVGGMVGLAAAAALVLVIARPWQSESVATHRDPVITAGPSPTPVAPVGTVEALTSLVWTSLPQADRYEVVLFDGDGTVLWEAQTSDSFAMVPDSVVVEAGALYFWRVRARTGFDRWAESHLTEFTVTSSAPGGP